MQMIKQDLEIINKLGLHARASTKLTQTASKFTSEVWIEKSGRRVNAKSIMGVMMLAAAKGATVTLEANGEDEAQALDSLKALINDYFGEGE
jgi:phosphocarrier protein